MITLPSAAPETALLSGLPVLSLALANNLLANYFDLLIKVFVLAFQGEPHIWTMNLQ